MNNKKHILEFITLLVVTVLLFSCSKEQKKYDGDPQLAFSENNYSFNISSSTSSISIPVQLIANKWHNVTGEITADQSSTALAAITFNNTFSMPSGEYSTPIIINIDYAILPDNESTLILQLSSNMKVAKYYGTATITLIKESDNNETDSN